MDPSQHILTWIECSAPHYERLCGLSNVDVWRTDWYRAEAALRLVIDAYREMIRTNDADAGNHDAGTILGAAVLIADWREEA